MLIDNYFVNRYDNIPVAIYTVRRQALHNRVSIAGMHSHREFEIVWIQEGCCAFTVNGECFVARAGDFVLINPYTVHTLDLPAGEKLTQSCICFDLSILGDAKMQDALESGQYAVDSHIDPLQKDYTDLCQMYETIVDHLLNKPGYWYYTVKGNLILLFSRLLSGHMHLLSTPCINVNEFCVKVMEYIDKNYHTDITSKTAAEYLSYNQSYFCRIFKSAFNSSFNDYLNMLRLSTSRNMLLQTTTSITDIALQCGFNSSGYYTDVFKKRFGMTPRQFREREQLQKTGFDLLT